MTRVSLELWQDSRRAEDRRTLISASREDALRAPVASTSDIPKISWSVTRLAPTHRRVSTHSTFCNLRNQALRELKVIDAL